MPSAYTTVYEASIPSIIDHTTKKIVSKLQVLLFDQVGHLLKNGIFLKDDLKKKETAYKSVNNVSSEGEGGGPPSKPIYYISLFSNLSREGEGGGS